VRPETYRQAYRTHLLGLQRAPDTIIWYTTLLDRFEQFVDSQGLERWDEVTPMTLLAYQAWVADQHDKWGKAYTIAVRNRHLIVVRGFFQYLCEAAYMAVNPAAEVILAREPHRLPKPVPSVRQMEQLLALPDIRNILGFRDRVIMEVFYSTGIRLAELINMRLEDIDMDHGFIMVRNGKGRKDRVVPMGKVAGWFLKVYLKTTRKRLRDAGRQDTGHVFLTHRGGPYSSRALQERIEWYAKRVPGVHVSPHVFRHAFATHLVQNHANIRHLQEMLGHAKLETTQRYVELTIVDLKSAHRRFHPRAQLFTRQPEPEEDFRMPWDKPEPAKRKR